MLQDAAELAANASERAANAPAAGLTRQALHAQRLAFVHPMTGEEMSFIAPLPEDLARTCQELGLGLP